ncbi:MAG: C-GCAxxG-C-C family protein [Slackia sp.]|nr:C-GCAxxG-C-C family protein [Slackia sp.]
MTPESNAACTCQADALPVFDREALAEHALKLHARNFNCAQCVTCTLAPFVRIDADTAFRATEGLGGGFGGFTETCGAIAGGAVVAGLARSNGYDDPTSKQGTYALSKQLVDRFRERIGSTLCKEIKAADGGEPLCACDECIVEGLNLAIDMLEDLERNPR